MGGVARGAAHAAVLEVLAFVEVNEEGEPLDFYSAVSGIPVSRVNGSSSCSSSLFSSSSPPPVLLPSSSSASLTGGPETAYSRTVVGHCECTLQRVFSS